MIFTPPPGGRKEDNLESAETWRAVVGYEGLYEVSNYGNVRSLPKYHTKRTIPLHPTRNKKSGRYSVMLTLNKVHKRVALHRIVAAAFVENPNPEKFTEVNHKDENPANNNADNLEWCDRKYNMNYNGLQSRMHDKIKKPVIGYIENVVVYRFESQQEAKRNGFHVNHFVDKQKLYKGLYWKSAEVENG